MAAAGILTYAYFALASHALAKPEYGKVVVVWSAVFVIVSTLYRPVEHLLSRSIAEHRALARSTRQPLRVGAAIQTSLGVAFLVAALVLRGVLEDDLLSGDETLYWVLVSSVLAYSASYFARGFLAGNRRFGVYTLLLLFDAASRACFAIAVAVGLVAGTSVVAAGIAAAPCFSLLAVPLAIGRRRSRPESGEGPAPPADGERDRRPQLTFAHGSGFAAAVLLIMFSEQVLSNAGPLLIRAEDGAAAAGFIFNMLLIARAPLLVFQAVSTSLLPHLSRLLSRPEAGGERAFRGSVAVTIMAVACVTGLAAVVVLIAGPQLMQLAFGDQFSYDRIGLLIMTAGMGSYLCAVTLTQAALARGQARFAAASYLAAAATFLIWNFLPIFDEFRRVETGFTVAALLLCGLLYRLYRAPPPRVYALAPGSTDELEARLVAADEGA
jgi:O-antigen/teichoic acid export membrane protein